MIVIGAHDRSSSRGVQAAASAWLRGRHAWIARRRSAPEPRWSSPWSFSAWPVVGPSITGKPGGTFADFSKDHQECVGELAVQTSANKAYGIVSPDLYRACMTGRGWSRRQHPEPVPEGWFRGIEDAEVIRLDTPPTQPWQKPSQQ